MKLKTSITLSEDLVGALGQIEEVYKNRSDLIEQALWEFLKKRTQRMREETDLKILNRKAVSLNQEAEEVLAYQVDL